jgi:single-strand DNA-binding protein
MNKVLLVGRLTRDPELRTLPSGKHVSTFTVATDEFRPGTSGMKEYHPCVAWDRLAEVIGEFVAKGQLVDIVGRLQTRQWDDDAGKRHWKTEVVVEALELLSGRDKGIANVEANRQGPVVAHADDELEEETSDDEDEEEDEEEEREIELVGKF